jgi:hypothetical protein
MTTFQFYLFTVPLVLSFGILTMQGWRENMKWRKKKVAQLADNAEEVQRKQRIAAARLHDEQVQVSTAGRAKNVGSGLIGSLMLIGTGTYGMNMLVRVLVLLYLCGLDRLVGSILLIEHDTDLRNRFRNRIPTIFHDRIVYGFSPTWSGGFANKSVTYVRERIENWGGPLRQAADQVADLHQRRTRGVPGQIIFFWSEGGQAPVALPVLEFLRKKFSEVQIVGMTSLPKEERNRQKFVELKPDYDRYVDGWVVSDRTVPGWETADYCMATLIVAPADAQLRDDVTTQFKNMLSLAFTEERGSVLALQFVHEVLPAFEWIVEGELLGYFIDKYRVVEVVQNALREIEQGNGMNSVRVAMGEPGTSVYDIVMCPLGYDERHLRDDMQGLSDAINEGYELRLTNPQARLPGMFYGLVNHELKFGSVAEAMQQNHPIFRVVAMRLAAIKDGHKIAEELVKVPDELLLPYERVAGQLVDETMHQTASVNGNGVHA